jgi:hypothetical protein
MDGGTPKAPVRRTLAAGVASGVLSIGCVGVIVAVYAIILAIDARGMPDTARINEFASYTGNWGWPIFSPLIALVVSFRVVRKIQRARALHGLAMGLTAAVTGLILGMVLGGEIDFPTLTG